MSDYFDGLMRSSGLPLGHAPVLGPSPRVAAPLTEVTVEVSAAEPLLGPLEVTAQAVQQAVASPPATRAAPSAAQPPAAADPRPLAETDRPATPVAHPTDTTAAMAPAPARVNSPRTDATSQSAPASLSARPVVEPTISHERIIQAAMRWVAAGPAPVSAEPRPPPDTAAATALSPVEPAAAPFAAVAADPPAVAATVIAQPTPERASRPAAAEIGPPWRAVAAPLAQALPPTRDDTVQVSIGAIHLRVEAPAPPIVQAAPTPPPRPAPDVPAVPRSGLSRRALRRI